MSAVKAYVGHSMAPAGRRPTCLRPGRLAARLHPRHHHHRPHRRRCACQPSAPAHAARALRPEGHAGCDHQLQGLWRQQRFGGCSSRRNSPPACSPSAGANRRSPATRGATKPCAMPAVSTTRPCAERHSRPSTSSVKGVLEGEDLSISADGIRLPGFGLPSAWIWPIPTRTWSDSVRNPTFPRPGRRSERRSAAAQALRPALP